MNFTAGKASVIAIVSIFVGDMLAQDIESRMPGPDAPHEGTWLQWPHQYTYGITFRDDVEPQWVAMTKALVTGERVHIIAYNQTEVNRITGLLNADSVPLDNVDFLIAQTNDFWVRDNGPIFVIDNNNKLKMTDWGFDGWGDDAPYAKDDIIPAAVAAANGLPLVDLNAMVLEGGSVELDGEGVLMATKSSILEPNRNPGLSQSQAEAYLRTNLGAEKFIWLDGADGGFEDITDYHIDGFAVFAPGGKIVTMNRTDLTYWGLSQADINLLYAATDIDSVPYVFVYLPLTSANVRTTYGTNLRVKGSYANYYVANEVVLMPSYNDVNDSVAKAILEGVYPNRTIVPIDCRNLYANGGMVHCVTQQQPAVILPKSEDLSLHVQEVNDSEVVLDFRGVPGLTYRLESTVNLLNQDWQAIDTFFLVNEAQTFQRPMTSENERFFRIAKP